MQPPWMNDESVPFQTVTLERLRFGLYQVISRDLTEDLVNPVQMEWMVRHLSRDIVFQVRAFIAAQHLDRAVVKYPANWREAVKASLYRWCSYAGGGHWPWFGEDFAPRYWPVQERVVTIDVKALYPKIAMPNERHQVVVMREERAT